MCDSRRTSARPISPGQASTPPQVFDTPNVEVEALSGCGLNLLRWLGNELRIPIVGAGTRDAWLAIRTDPQLENRFEPFVLPAWQAGPDAARLLQGFATLLPLRRPSDLRGAGLVGSVVARTSGIIGEIAALLRAAAEAAIAGGEERITRDVLARAAYRGPVERRQTMERELA